MPVTTKAFTWVYEVQLNTTTGTYFITAAQASDWVLGDDVTDKEPLDGSSGDGAEITGETLCTYRVAPPEARIGEFYSGWMINGDPVTWETSSSKHILYSNTAGLDGSSGTATAGTWYYFQDPVAYTGDAGNNDWSGDNGSDTASGLDGADTLRGFIGADFLDGGTGADSLVGGDGDDILYAGDDTDDDTLSGGAGDDVLVASTGMTQGSDQLFGDAGNDTLHAGSGGNELSGGDGDDTYDLRSDTDMPDSITELASGGVDTVIVAGSFSMNNQYVEKLVGYASEGEFFALSGRNSSPDHDGTDVITGISTAASSGFTIIGYEGDDTLTGGMGRESLYGGLGEDVLVGGGERDFLYGNEGNDYLAGGGSGEADSINGNDVLFGGDGNDTLLAGDAGDYLGGGQGDDVYDLRSDKDNPDVIDEHFNEGSDTIVIAANYTLLDGSHLENLVGYAGDGQTLTLTGESTANHIRGVVNDGVAQFVLIGGDGNDTLVGSAGADTLIGGDGDDVYQLGSDGTDILTEDENGGHDSVVVAGISFSIASLFVEALTGHAGDAQTLMLTGNAGDNLITGFVDAGSGKFSLMGGEGNDTLVGSSATDTLTGGSGNDTYRIGSDASDSIVEDGDGGSDTVEAFNISYALNNDVAVENLRVEGDVFAFLTLTGNAADNIISAVGEAVGARFTLLGGLGNDLLTGSNASEFGARDYLEGGAGNDTLVASNGNDKLFGGDGDDVYDLRDDAGTADTIYEDDDQGNDTILVDVSYALTSSYIENLSGYAPDFDVMTLTGNNADNRVTGIAGGSNSRFTLNGYDGNDTLVGSLGNDWLHGQSGDDSLAGGGGHDLLDGADDNDTLVAGEGKDTLYGGAGNDVYDLRSDDAETDSIQEAYDSGIDGIIVNGAYSLYGIDIENLTAYAATATTVTLTGNHHDNVIVGNAASSATHFSIDGSWGSDTLHGSLGNDLLVGDEVPFDGSPEGGNDSLNGGAGNDTLIGGEGNDTLIAGSGDDSLVGGMGDDFYGMSTDGYTVIDEFADAGNDTLLVTGFSFSLDGTHIENLIGLAADGISLQLNGTAGANIINGTAISGSPLFQLYGEDGNDTLTGAAGNDVLVGGSGADAMAGGEGDDYYLLGDDTTDTLLELEGGGIDTVEISNVSHNLSANFENINAFADDGISLSFIGNAEANLISVQMNSGIADFTIDGGAGNDTLNGHNGSDLIDGGDGDDEIYCGGGFDTVHGGAGNDMLDDYNGLGSGDYTLYGDAGNDTLYGSAGDCLLEGGADNDVIYMAGSGTARGGDGDDLLTVWEHAGTTDNLLYGDAGDDTMTGLDGRDTLAGGADSDSMAGGGGNDVLLGDTGNDLLSGGVGKDALYGGSEHDQLNGDDGNDRLIGNEGDDTISGGAGNDELIGYQGNDALAGDEGDDDLRGGLGDDTLAGGKGSDTLHGGNADDTLDGGFGADLLTGGTGADLFSFSTVMGVTVDTITDFSHAQGDVIAVAHDLVNIKSAGELLAYRFVLGTEATASTHRFVYDGIVGNLYYDADGSGAGAAIHLVTLGNLAVLTASDIVIV